MYSVYLKYTLLDGGPATAPASPPSTCPPSVVLFGVEVCRNVCDNMLQLQSCVTIVALHEEGLNIC